MILFKGRIVCVINLLVLLSKNKNIVDVVRSSLCINFDQTMVRIYFDFSISGIIPIAFELKKNCILLAYDVVVQPPFLASHNNQLQTH